MAHERANEMTGGRFHGITWGTVVVVALIVTWIASVHDRPAVEGDILAEVAKLPVPGPFLANLANTLRSLGRIEDRY